VYDGYAQTGTWFEHGFTFTLKPQQLKLAWWFCVGVGIEVLLEPV
jgi:hypothetical protein